MSAAIGNGNITFGDGSVQSSKSLAVSAQVFTSSGTFTIPATKVKVTVIGAGGGAVNSGAYSGAGAGGTAIKWLSGLTVGATLTVTIGTGGSAGASGGSSTVTSGTQTISTITGGGGSTGGAYYAGNNGGSASI